MKMQQLSVFLENKPGHLSAPCRALADAGINIVTLSLADTQQFGILRLIVRDWEKAKERPRGGRLRGQRDRGGGHRGATTGPGGLAEILDVLEQAGHQHRVHVRLHPPRERQRGARLPLRRPGQAAIAALQAGGVNVLDNVELYRRAEAP